MSRLKVPRRCRERSDTGGQCEYSAGHKGRHSFMPLYVVHSGYRRNAMPVQMPGHSHKVDAWPTIRGWCRLYAQGMLTAEELKGYIWVQLALKQHKHAARKINNTINYYRRYKNGMVQ